MKRAWRGAMPVALTLPLGLERRPRRRQTRFRRLAIGALLVGAALLAAGLWLPAKAELAQRLLHRVSGHATEAQSTASAGAAALPRLATLEVGDEVEIEPPGGPTSLYRVTALDIVDGRRAELAGSGDDGVVVLATSWPFDAPSGAGQWRYLVTARRVDAPGELVAATEAF